MTLLTPLTRTARTVVDAARGGTNAILDVAHGTVRRVRAAARRDRDGAAADPARPATGARSATQPQATGARTVASHAPAAAPSLVPRPEEAEPSEPDQPEFAARHIDEEPAEVVYTSSDEGAQEGAGASLHIDEPWPGYRAMAAADIIDRLALADTAMLAAVRLFETSSRARPSVLKAVELRLDAARS